MAPWRKPRPDLEREHFDREHFDRHGVPRCPHCGGPGDQESAGLGYYQAKGQPRIRFGCQLRITPDRQVSQG